MRRCRGSANRKSSLLAREDFTLIETVSGYTAVMRARFREGLGPLGVVECVGIELGLQSDTAVPAVVDAALAGLVQEIAGIELDAGAIGVDRHGAAGDGVGKIGAGVAKDFEIVVIAALQVQRFIMRSDILTDGLGGAKI